MQHIWPQGGSSWSDLLVELSNDLNGQDQVCNHQIMQLEIILLLFIQQQALWIMLQSHCSVNTFTIVLNDEGKE